MKTIEHGTPEQCLEELKKVGGDGGRSAYLDRYTREGILIERPKGDCGIVACVYAQFYPPSTSYHLLEDEFPNWYRRSGESYLLVKNSLDSLLLDMDPEMHQRRRSREPWLEYVRRRVRQFWCGPPVLSMNGTVSFALETYLCNRSSSIYRVAYVAGHEKLDQWRCICTSRQSHVVVMQFIRDKDHSACVRGGVMYNAVPLDPKTTFVALVFSLRSEFVTEYFGPEN